ncbi:MAG: YceI family protein [Opitutaceae bacterium]|jgi:polyisoprenoid-binding protein YceI
MKLRGLFLTGLLPVVLAAAPASLVIDSAQSRVEVVVEATVDSFTGKLNAYKADITVDEGRITAATFNFRFADVHTGKDGRDESMHEWQDTPKHPNGTFTLHSLDPISGDRFTAHGTLVFHDITREIAFPVVVMTDRKIYSIDGTAPFDTRDFGLPVIHKFGLLRVDPVVTVRFHLQGSARTLVAHAST